MAHAGPSLAAALAVCRDMGYAATSIEAVAVAERFLNELLEPRRTSAAQRLTLAAERGELPPTPDAMHLIELLYAPCTTDC